MPIETGSATFSRFTVKPPAGDPRRWLPRGLARGAFEPLDVERSDEDRAAGFVERGDPDATGFATGDVAFGEWTLFSWRVDTVTVRASAVKPELARWEAAFVGKQRRPPARAERAAAREEIRRTLRLRTPPTTRTVEIAWHLGTGELLAWTATRKAVDEIAAAVEGAFGAKLTPGTVAALAARRGAAVERLGLTRELAGVPAELEVAR